MSDEEGERSGMMVIRPSFYRPAAPVVPSCNLTRRQHELNEPMKPVACVLIVALSADDARGGTDASAKEWNGCATHERERERLTLRSPIRARSLRRILALSLEPPTAHHQPRSLGNSDRRRQNTNALGTQAAARGGAAVRVDRGCRDAHGVHDDHQDPPRLRGRPGVALLLRHGPR